jgi:ketosteroid isomerase-like protein
MSDTAAREVADAVRRFMAAYDAKDAEALQALVVGDEIVLVGTGSDEVVFGLASFRKQTERDFSQADDLMMAVDNLRVHTFGDAAFAYCDVTVSGTAGGQAFQMPGLRCTLGLVRTADGWRFAQSHLSAPAGGQEVGSSF